MDLTSAQLKVLQDQYSDVMKGRETDTLVISAIEHNLRMAGYPDFADRVHNKLLKIYGCDVMDKYEAK